MGDFNNDGQLDFIASNWGENTKWHPSLQNPVSLYYGDFDGNGAIDLLETQHDPVLGRQVLIKGHRLTTMALPRLKEKFPTRQAFANATVEELIGPAFKNSPHVKITEVRTMLFLREGNHFVPTLLPREAQFAPAFGVAVADFNLDGNLDVALAQNFFATPLDTPRSDAGMGLLLLGNGKGGFASASPAESGLGAFGEGRAAAVCDFDHDGRSDLLITQHAAPTLLYKNNGPAGVRVRVQGTAGNPHAVDVKLRSSKGGPLHEIHAGEGYWTVNSPVVVLPANTAEVEASWPGQPSRKIPIPTGSREVVIPAP